MLFHCILNTFHLCYLPSDFVLLVVLSLLHQLTNQPLQSFYSSALLLYLVPQMYHHQFRVILLALPSVSLQLSSPQRHITPILSIGTQHHKTATSVQMSPQPLYRPLPFTPFHPQRTLTPQVRHHGANGAYSLRHFPCP